MSQRERIEPAFTSVQDEQLPEPRALSGLAIAALVLGIVSAGAVAVPLMWLVPVAGATLALAALASIARAPEVRIGRSVAIAGLLLSLLFASWGVSNHVTRQRLLFQQAENFARSWLQLVLDGKLREAHQLSLTQDERHAPGTDLVEFYERSDETRSGYEEFWKNSPLPDLTKFPADASCRLVRNERLELERDIGANSEIITQQFEIVSQQVSPPQRLALQMVLSRVRHRDSGEARWRVVAVNSVSERRR